jgi:hypothetical protein
LPVGGIGNVVKLFNLLSSPVTSERKEFISIKETGKILCLIDTDNLRLNFFGGDRDNIVQLRRLQLTLDNRDVLLVDPARQGEHYSRTVIEDCLDPKTFYDAIEVVIAEHASEEIQQLFKEFSYNENSFVSSISGYHSIIRAKDMIYYDRRSEIEEFLSRNEIKYLVAKAYNNNCIVRGNVQHKLETQIMSLFNMVEEMA